MNYSTRVTWSRPIIVVLVVLCLIVLSITVRYDYLAYGSALVAAIAALIVYLNHQRQGEHDPVEWYDEPRVIADWDEFSHAAQTLGPKVREQNEWVFRHFKRKYANATCSSCEAELHLAYFARYSVPPHVKTGYCIVCPKCRLEFGRIDVLPS